jgi:uncharacterized lipoprotein NlpE involved in copper resistance
MRRVFRTIVLVAMCGALAMPACKKGKETETAVDTKPTRPPSPSGTMSLHGMYSQSGAYGTFRDCATGEQWPVAQEGDNRALEQAYAESGAQPGPLVVTVEGGIDYRPVPDGSGRAMMLIVARFVQVGPGNACRQ